MDPPKITAGGRPLEVYIDEKETEIICEEVKEDIQEKIKKTGHYHRPVLKRFGYTTEQHGECRRYSMAEIFEHVLDKIHEDFRKQFVETGLNGQKKIKNLWILYQKLPSKFTSPEVKDVLSKPGDLARRMKMFEQADLVTIDRSGELIQYEKIGFDPEEVLEQLITNNSKITGYDRPGKTQAIKKPETKKEEPVQDIKKTISDPEFLRFAERYYKFRELYPNWTFNKFLEIEKDYATGN